MSLSFLCLLMVFVMSLVSIPSVSYPTACAVCAGESYFISKSTGSLGKLHSCHRIVARFCPLSSLCNRRFSPFCCPKDPGILPQQDEPENQHLGKVSRAFSICLLLDVFNFAENGKDNPEFMVIYYPAVTFLVFLFLFCFLSF